MRGNYKKKMLIIDMGVMAVFSLLSLRKLPGTKFDYHFFARLAISFL
jgi:hypothetical protein